MRSKSEMSEPVAWMTFDPAYMQNRIAWNTKDMQEAGPGLIWNALYARPPRREWVGLTDEEIEQLMKWPEKGTDLLAFARAIEAKLKERNT